MKNKLYNNILIATLAVFLCTANVAYAKIPLPENIKAIAHKYISVMISIVVVSLIIFIGLHIYNKFFVDVKIKNYRLNKESLKTPEDKNEAILTFITKNRLR